MQVLEGFIGAGNTLENFMTRDVVMTTDHVSVGSFFLMRPIGTHFYDSAGCRQENMLKEYCLDASAYWALSALRLFVVYACSVTNK